MDLLGEMPPMVNSDFCKEYADADKGVCNPNCPFYLECLPYFEALAKELEEHWQDAEAST
jgi:hypothetical protein